MERLTGDHIQSFLQTKVEAGVAHATYQQYAAAVQKLESALNGLAAQKDTGRRYDFQAAISSVFAKAKGLEKFEGTRAYEHPNALITQLKPAHQIAARIQHEGGARVREAALIRADQLVGDGKIHIDSVGAKGGKARDIQVSSETYRLLKDHIEIHGKFRIEQNTYRSDNKTHIEVTSARLPKKLTRHIRAVMA